jgi:hypothetical protein
MTPSTRPVTRLTSAYVFDRGARPLVATITGSLIELRAKGLRSTETLDLASMYHFAIKARLQRDRDAKKAAKKAKSTTHQEQAMNCPQCQRPNAPLGAFGRLQHYHCRACGWHYNNQAERNRRKPAAPTTTTRS